MGLFGQMARGYVANRLMRGAAGRGSRQRYRYGHSRPGARYARRRRGRGGFFGPLPYYSTRTRRGSRVTVSGCCLPIPLALTLAAGAAAGTAIRRR